MTGERCEGCDRSVPVAGGIANVWTLGGTQTGGMTLELTDGTEHFLCFECIDELDDDPTAADVAGLPYGPRDEQVRTGADDGGAARVGLGIAVGALAGAALAVALDSEVEPLLATGAAIGIGLALLAERLREGS